MAKNDTITTVHDLDKTVNVHAISMSVEEARAYLDGDFEMSDVVDFDNIMDEAQGEVYKGQAAKTYVLIEITK